MPAACALPGLGVVPVLLPSYLQGQGPPARVAVQCHPRVAPLLRLGVPRQVPLLQLGGPQAPSAQTAVQSHAQTALPLHPGVLQLLQAVLPLPPGVPQRALALPQAYPPAQPVVNAARHLGAAGFQLQALPYPPPGALLD